MRASKETPTELPPSSAPGSTRRGLPKSESRLKVLTVISTIEPELGGPSSVAVNAVIAERAAGMDTTIVSTVASTDAADTQLERRLALAGVPHVRFGRPPVKRELMKRWGVSLGLAVYVLRNSRRFDVIHAHYVWSIATVCSVLAGWLWRKPVVLTPHESLTRFGIETSRSSMRRRQKLWYASLLLRGVNGIIVSSDLERGDSLLGDATVFVIAHPVAPTELGVVPPERGQDESLVVGYLGRLHPKKRVGLAIETLDELSKDSRLVIGGDEPPESLGELKALAGRLGLTERINFLGFVQDQDRPRFFSSIDVLVMPSTYECFGMVAAEAMAAGVPVVVSDQTGVASTVSKYEAGMVFPVNEPERLTAALEELQKDRARLASMAVNGREAALCEFSYGAFARHTEAVYERLRSEPGSARASAPTRRRPERAS